MLIGMGQSNSAISDHLECVDKIQDGLFRQARVISTTATCSYKEFLNYIEKLNAISSQVACNNGKRLFFAIKTGTDETVLWRATVRIAVVQTDATFSRIDSHRLLTMPQFLRVFSTLQEQMFSALRHSSTEEDPTDRSASPHHGETSVQSRESSKTEKLTKLATRKDWTYSMLLNEVDQVVSDNPEKLCECCICLERRPDIMLPCAHAFCTSCIEQWNSSHKTCPICRETLESTDDAWVMSDIPGSEDISREIRSALFDLSTEPEASQP